MKPVGEARRAPGSRASRANQPMPAITRVDEGRVPRVEALPEGRVRKEPLQEPSRVHTEMEDRLDAVEHVVVEDAGPEQRQRHLEPAVDEGREAHEDEKARRDREASVAGGRRAGGSRVRARRAPRREERAKRRRRRERTSPSEIAKKSHMSQKRSPGVQPDGAPSPRRSQTTTTKSARRRARRARLGDRRFAARRRLTTRAPSPAGASPSSWALAALRVSPGASRRSSRRASRTSGESGGVVSS